MTSEETKDLQKDETVAVDQESEKEVKPKVEGKDSMASLIEEMGDKLLPFAEGDMVESSVLAIGGNRIWVDVAGQSLGFIPEKEITTKTGLKIGDKIYSTVLSMEDEEGNVVLSMKRADREKYWQDMETAFANGTPVIAKITDANKGGLMTDIGGIMGFLPVSQLAPIHYPRVSGGDKDEILNRLRKFIGQDFTVKVITCEKDTSKLIFSEKAVKAEEVKAKIDKFAVGDIVKGKITGIVHFGLFVSIDPEIEALVHISEVSWSHVDDLHKLFKVGDEIETQVISVEDGRVSLSLKKLLPDPWVKAASRYQVGQVVEGEVTKRTPYGAFVALDDEISGLFYNTKLLFQDAPQDTAQTVELGKKYKFKITSIEVESHRLGLALDTPEKEAKTPAKKVEKKVKEEIVEAPKVVESVEPVVEKKKAVRPKKTKKIEDIVGAE
ncbi:MAG: S1 RNA-binding domain-containing protein [Candidatus Berkelbacteria bacterium]|nr:S1 RNA-binding domain-containing protein [Candidatus Berkelbacteria bacterium]